MEPGRERAWTTPFPELSLERMGGNALILQFSRGIAHSDEDKL